MQIVTGAIRMASSKCRCRWHCLATERRALLGEKSWKLPLLAEQCSALQWRFCLLDEN
jgi:hypothetical protein